MHMLHNGKDSPATTRREDSTSMNSLGSGPRLCENQVTLQFAYSAGTFLDRSLQLLQILGEKLVVLEGAPQIFEQQLAIER